MIWLLIIYIISFIGVLGVGIHAIIHDNRHGFNIFLSDLILVIIVSIIPLINSYGFLRYLYDERYDVLGKVIFKGKGK